MITEEEILILNSPEVRESIEANIEKDPHKIALDKRLPFASTIATQVKYLQRARKKLPSFFEARAIVPSLAFEQSSSEESAKAKVFSGKLCIDLTCGLGVDSYSLSKKFDMVISVERNSALAQVADINFQRLGVENITVMNNSAEDAVAQFASEGLNADLIYVDPDRRAQGKKQVALEECTPNVITLLPLMKKIAGKIVIKNSPLFDVDEAFRIFGDRCRVSVVSLGGECKEVLIEIDDSITAPSICAIALGVGLAEYPFVRENRPYTNKPFDVEAYRYMIIPDVSLRKSRLSLTHYNTVITEAFTYSNDGYVFAEELPSKYTTNGERLINKELLGKVFEIKNMIPYNAKTLKRLLRENDIRSADIFTASFPRTATDICRELGIKEGGVNKLAFTKIENTLWCIHIKAFADDK